MGNWDDINETLRTSADRDAEKERLSAEEENAIRQEQHSYWVEIVTKLRQVQDSLTRKARVIPDLFNTGENYTLSVQQELVNVKLDGMSIVVTESGKPTETIFYSRAMKYWVASSQPMVQTNPLEHVGAAVKRFISKVPLNS